MQAVDQTISLAIQNYATNLEKHFRCDVIAYMGPIYPYALTRYREIIEGLKSSAQKPDGHQSNCLIIVLTTVGGVVETVEKMVQITRHHYQHVSFIVPDMAMSAGTVWCMSGDRIYMDYASSLGPIDPQVQSSNGTGGLVPALGYLEKVREFIEKSNNNCLSAAEVVMLRGLDLAELHRFEQAKELSISLLKQWLVKYKFKNWTEHRTTKPGSAVTEAEREERAQEIAGNLMDNNRWHSHGRMIDINTLKNDLRLEIDDYSNVPEVRENVRVYNSLLAESMDRQGFPLIIHSARG